MAIIQKKLMLTPQNTYAHILAAFHDGRPLTSDELNLLYRYHSQLSSPLKQVADYYKVTQKFTSAKLFVSSANSINALAAKQLKQRIGNLLAKGSPSVETRLTPAQFIQLKATTPELMFWHGNQSLTGAPFIAGGVPHVDFFQWGNLFGVVKYHELISEKALNANILIYFEDKGDQFMDDCIAQYQKKMANLQENQHKVSAPASHLTLDNHPIPQSYYTTPKLRC